MTDETKDDSYPPASAGWTMAAVLFVLYVISVTDRFILSFVVGPVKADMGVSDLDLSYLNTILFVFYSCCALPIGYLVDRYPRRNVVFGGVLLWSIAAVSSGLVRSFGALMGVRALVGGGEATLHPCTYSMLADLFAPKRLALAIGVFVMGGTTGIGLSYLVGGPLVQALTANGSVTVPIFGTLHPWQQAFVLTGAPGLIICFLIFLLPEPVRRRAPDANRGAYGDAFRYMLRRPYFYISHFFAFALLQAAMGAAQFWLPVVFQRVHHWSPQSTGITLGLLQIVTAVIGLSAHGVIVGKLYARGMRNAHFRWMALMSALSTPFAIAAFVVGGWQMALLLLTPYYLMAICASSFGPASLQIAVPPVYRGRITSVYMIVLGLTSAISPSIPPAISDLFFHDEQKIGWGVAIAVGGLLALCATLLATGARTAREAVLDLERG
jgi:MFS family permease